MSDIAMTLVSAARAQNPNLSAEDLEHVHRFGIELQEAAAPSAGQQANEITRDEGLRLARSAHLIGAGARPALNHLLEVMAPRRGIATPASLKLAPEARAILDWQRATIAQRDFLEWSGFAAAERFWINAQRGASASLRY